MKLSVFFVGKTDAAFAKLVADYLNRIRHYTTIEEKVVPDLKGARALSPRQQCEKEGEMLLKVLPPQSEVFLLDESGKTFSSVELAAWFEKKMVYGVKEVALVVGGAYGFSDEVRARANGFISLSKLTFSHQMVRVILLEQVYRAFTIIRGEPYHHS